MTIDFNFDFAAMSLANSSPSTDKAKSAKFDEKASTSFHFDVDSSIYEHPHISTVFNPALRSPKTPREHRRMSDNRSTPVKLQNLASVMEKPSRKDEADLKHYVALCRPKPQRQCKSAEGDQLTAPLFSQKVREVLSYQKVNVGQFGLLGHIEQQVQPLEEPTNSSSSFTFRGADANSQASDIDPVFINTNSPWSAFVCGSQGSGKSYTTACLLECFLAKDQRIGNLQSPASAIVFNYDRMKVKSHEIAALCSAGIHVEVLVPHGNRTDIRNEYASNYPEFIDETLTVKPLYLQSKHLNSERIQSFMAVSAAGNKPLYMNMLERLLRDMAREREDLLRKKPKKNLPRFDYAKFRARLESEKFSDLQREPLDQRLSCIESFFGGPEVPINRVRDGKPCPSKQRLIDDRVDDDLKGKPGHVILVDLTDPTYDASVACAMFTLCLGVFIENTTGPKIIALDEAHNYIGKGSSSEIFTEDLLKVIREQRHTGSRVIIATQEPTVSTKFLDLCTMTMVHRFTSPDWFRTLRAHLGGASAEAGITDAEMKDLFIKVGDLEPGEFLLFSPTALLDVVNGTTKRLHFGHKVVRTRLRISEDAGKSKMAAK